MASVCGLRHGSLHASACRRPPAALLARPCRISVPARAPSVRVAAVAATAPVRITIQGRRLPVTPAIREYVEEKLSNAVKFYSNIVKKIDVTISARGGDTGTHGAKQQKVDVTIHTVRHGVVRVEDAEASLYASIDLVCDKAFRKLNKIKERTIGRRVAGREDQEAEYSEYLQSLVVATASLEEEEEARAVELVAPPTPQALPATILRSKVLTLSEAISVGEAVEQMEAIGHDFYVFREADTDTLQVVYKRDSGGYGILIPQKGN